MIKLGDKVRDDVSGIVGIAMNKLEHLNGCIQFGVEPSMNKKTNEIVTFTIDEINLTKIGSGLNKKAKLSKKKPKRKPGGPTTKTVYQGEKK